MVQTAHHDSSRHDSSRQNAAPTGVRVGRVHGVGAVRARPGGAAPTRTRDNALAGHYARRLVEVLSGHRVCDQLAALTTEDVYDDVRTLVRRRALRGPGDALPVLGRVFDDSPAPGVLEVTAAVALGERVEMLAFRLELRRVPRRPEPAWRFTALETRW
ncbi:Rv3235 family protein [Streptacidiphilus sp. EB129]|uniref:Rv3235 family protein n=1 Tax=Streptacidiphilus sp. EB129 TaxID=3156262 RepID=UPI003515EE5D